MLPLFLGAAVIARVAHVVAICGARVRAGDGHVTQIEFSVLVKQHIRHLDVPAREIRQNCHIFASENGVQFTPRTHCANFSTDQTHLCAILRSWCIWCKQSSIFQVNSKTSCIVKGFCIWVRCSSKLSRLSSYRFIISTNVCLWVYVLGVRACCSMLRVWDSGFRVQSARWMDIVVEFWMWDAMIKTHGRCSMQGLGTRCCMQGLDPQV